MRLLVLLVVIVKQASVLTANKFAAPFRKSVNLMAVGHLQCKKSEWVPVSRDATLFDQLRKTSRTGKERVD